MPLVARIARLEQRAAHDADSMMVAFVDDAGSIVEGKRADLAILDRNPFAGSVYEIAQTRVTTALASGRVVHGG